MHHPGHSSGRICCPRCWVSSQLTAPSIQLLQGLPQRQRIISAKAMSYPRQPTSSDQSWWGYEGPAFWPIADNSDGHCLRLVRPASGSHFFLYLPWCWFLINTLDPHSVSLGVCFQRAQLTTLGSGKLICDWFVLSAMARVSTLFSRPLPLLLGKKAVL